MSQSSPLILAFGDSLVAGYGLPVVDGFAAQLERALPGAQVVSAGVSGDTTGEALRRLPQVLSRLDRRPSLAIVQLGPNDVLRQVPPSLLRANLDAILVEFSRCVPVMLTTVTPPPRFAQHAAPYDGIHAELAERHGTRIWPFFPTGILGHRDMVLADRVHPNGKAIAAVVDAMLLPIKRALSGNGMHSCDRKQTVG